MAPLSWRFDNRYARLPDALFAYAKPARARDPRLVVFNETLACSLGLDPDLSDRAQLAALLSGNTLPEGAQPIAQAYAGHQFGHFAMLGDGRALLLGEHLCPDGQRVDVQFKGSGPTPFSRRGDGRAALGPMLREHLISEAMHALGIPTTRSLAVVATGEAVLRENILDGAVLTRIAASHLRVGTFEYVAARNDPSLLDALIAFTIDRHYPACREAERPALALLEAVIERQAFLIAEWMRVGFIHGVMNTDNMSLCGETIDYGPCAFLDVYDPATAFSSIDRGRRYAFGNQPQIAQWNLARLAEALMPAIDADGDRALDLAQHAIERFGDLFARYHLDVMRRKLGLDDDTRADDDQADDAPLIEQLLDWMQSRKADYTQSFRMLGEGLIPAERLATDTTLSDWHTRWQARLNRSKRSAAETSAAMNANNPIYIARNHQVEAALEAATGPVLDIVPFEKLLTVLRTPYAAQPECEAYAAPPPPGGRPYQTFCGT